MIPAIIVGVVLGGVILLFWLAARAGGKMMAEQAARLASSTPATATITQVHRRGMSQSSRHVVLITMRVKPAGGEPYEATVSWWVDVVVMPRVQPGLEVEVKIDATDRMRVYPNDRVWTEREVSYAAV